MTALVSFLNSVLFHSLWEDSIIAVLLAMGLRATSRQAPTVRYGMACIGLVLIAIAPVVTAAATHLTGNVVPATVGHPADLLPPVNTVTFTALLAASRSSTIPSWRDLVAQWALPCWLAGVLSFSVRHVTSALAIAVLRRRAVAAGHDIQRMVDTLAVRLGVRRRVVAVVS